ncbi:calpain-9-like isoform X1 [Asterias amurensis]|uniref:calpain-9-like isoform X1 n=1 Tax=Asterias amurensis TaxID=7602 RepID=UPI003AB21F08
MPRRGPTYKEIRRKFNANNLYEDPEFPAVEKSLFFSQSPGKRFEWKRPHELCENPQLFVGGASRFDIAQGELGDCWFLAALASLSLDDYLLKRVCPEDQGFDRNNYCGAFYFQFWQYGKWVEVIIDDRLPTYNGRLVFVHSESNNEFWSALLEKAYAKLHGSYEALKGGNVVEAMEDFTGGFSETHDLKKAPRNLFKILFGAYNSDSQMGCSIDQAGRGTEAKLDNGLIVGHAYTITDVKRVSLPSYPKPVRLIRIRNPWGQVEWNGRWSDKSYEWKSVSDRQRKELGLETKDDGEFWMEYTDFLREYSRVDICHLSPDKAPGGKKKKSKWVVSEIEGRWQKNMSAGGCRNFPDTFWINPQIEMMLEEEDDEEDDDDEDDDGSPAAKQKGATVMIGLLQKNRRKQIKMGIGNLTIGFAIYEYKDGQKTEKLPKDFFLRNASKARSDTFINTREIMGRFKMKPGRYCIIPSTFEQHKEGDFLIRIYSLKKASSVTLEDKTGVVDLPQQPRSQQVAKPEPTKEASAAEREMKAKFFDFFKRITGDDMEVDAVELREILNAALKKEMRLSELTGTDGFSLESCKSMVASSDSDRSGKLGFEEFLELWNGIRKWKMVFAQFDKDRSGSFSAYELQLALNAIGYRVSTKTLGAMVLRFANTSGQISFDDFICCTVKLKHMIESFLDNARGSTAQYSMDEFLAIGMYS